MYASHRPGVLCDPRENLNEKIIVTKKVFFVIIFFILIKQSKHAPHQPV